MSRIQMLKMSVSRAAGRSGLLLQKHSPEILLGAGIVGMVATTVMACKATLKAEDVIEEAKHKLDKVNFAKTTVSKEDYSDKDYKKDLVVVYAQTGVDFVKLYAPAVTVGALSIACILSSYNIMSKRNLALVAAYKAVEQSFSDYRKRVVAEYGEDKDRQFKYGIEKSKISVTEVDENGKEKKTKVDVENIDTNNISQYARFFDESCANWTKTPEYNLMFVKSQQNYANDLLNSRGHLFLNEVYDMLGISRSQAGAVVGWVKGVGDDFVDFGIYDSESLPKRRFVNGDERNILLDFNVSGVIYDMI